MQPDDKKVLIKKLESDGELKVREKLADGLYGRRKLGTITQWLGQFDSARETTARNTEMRQARYNSRIAIWGVIVALLSIAIAVYLAA